MTVMDTTDTGGMQIFEGEIANGTSEVDRIHAEVAAPVWQLMRAGLLPAALVLLKANAVRFYEAWRKEFTGIAVPAKVVRDVVGCTSMHHYTLDCPTALAEGKLPPDAAFCEHCSGEQIDMEPAAEEITEGSLVHIVTPVGRTTVRRRKAS